MMPKLSAQESTSLSPEERQACRAVMRAYQGTKIEQIERERFGVEARELRLDAVVKQVAQRFGFKTGFLHSLLLIWQWESEDYFRAALGRRAQPFNFDWSR